MASGHLGRFLTALSGGVKHGKLFGRRASTQLMNSLREDKLMGLIVGPDGSTTGIHPLLGPSPRLGRVLIVARWRIGSPTPSEYA